MTPFGEREYRIEKYDVDDDPGKDGRWETVATVRGTANAVREVQKLREQCYDRNSIYVERIDDADIEVI